MLAGAGRLYAQRHGAYVELARFLERQRLTLELTELPVEPPDEPPDPLTADAWMDMRSRWMTLASADVRKELDVASERFGDFVSTVLVAR